MSAYTPAFEAVTALGLLATVAVLYLTVRLVADQVWDLRGLIASLRNDVAHGDAPPHAGPRPKTHGED